MPQVEIKREHTVYADEDGREYFLIQHADNVMKRVYLDEYNNENNLPQDNPSNQQTILVVPNNDYPSNTPPPQYWAANDDVEKDNSTANPDVIVIKTNSAGSEKLDTVQEEEDDLDDNNPTVIYLKDNESQQNDVSNDEAPQESPQVIYLNQESPNSPSPKPIIAVLEDDPPSDRSKPRRFNHKVPESPVQYYQRPNYYDDRSTTSTSSGRTPHLKPYRTNKKHSKYNPVLLPEQQSTQAGGLLIVDNEPWEAKSKINTRNPNYRRGGGNVNIPNKNLNWNSTPRIDAYNREYHRGGGDRKIVSQKISWDGKPRVDHINTGYQRNGGNVLIFHENLKWKKGLKNKLSNKNNRSFSSADVHYGVVSPNNDVHRKSAEVHAPSPIEEKQTYDYTTLAKKTGYALNFKGKIHRTKGKDLPPLTEIVSLNEQQKHEEKHQYEKERNIDKQNQYIKEYSPRLNQEPRPHFRLTSKKEVIPPIISDLKEPFMQPRKGRPIEYVLPNRKQLPWKDSTIEKVSAKTLEDMSKPTKKQNRKNPQYSLAPKTEYPLPMNQSPDGPDLYDYKMADNYGGYYNEEYFNDSQNYYNVPRSDNYNADQGRSSHRYNDKRFSPVHHLAGKRNNPVY